MARKTLLSEGEIRQFMKLANLDPLAETYISNSEVGLTTEQDEEEMELGGELEMDPEPPMDAMDDAMDDEMPPAEGGGEEDLVLSLLQAVQDWAEEHGVDMSLDGDEGGEEIEDVDAIEMDDDGMDMEMDMEMGAEEEEAPGAMDMYEEGAAEKKADDKKDDDEEEPRRRQSYGSKMVDRQRERGRRPGVGIAGITKEGEAAEKKADRKDDDEEEPRRRRQSAADRAKERMRGNRGGRNAPPFGGVSKYEEGTATEDIVAEVAQRVMERLSGAAEKKTQRDEIAEQLAERIFKRLAQK